MESVCNPKKKDTNQKFAKPRVSDNRKQLVDQQELDEDGVDYMVLKVEGTNEKGRTILHGKSQKLKRVQNNDRHGLARHNNCF